ncbi:LysR family transcriptional regulator [Shewanella psychropiezotolerans]|nr:LysR family transcriptional regulator [Shewanella psychropiezotolerans]
MELITMVTPDINLRSVDLNLLTVLEQLFVHKHISHAAKALNMSQPAVSRALARLREQFQDPLLVKTSFGYQLTPKAQRLSEQITQMLSVVRQILQADEFDPSEYSGVFTISALDFEMMMLLPKLLSVVHKKAPKLKIQIIQHNPFIELGKYLEQVTQLLLYSTDASPTNVFKQRLFNDNYAVIMCANNPLVKEVDSSSTGLTLESYIQSSHVIVSGNGLTTTDIDIELKTRGYERDVVSAIPHFSLIPDVVKNSNLIATMPRRMVNHLKPRDDFYVTDLPFKTPDFLVEQFWHKIHHHCPIHQWIRNELKAIATHKFD